MFFRRYPHMVDPEAVGAIARRPNFMMLALMHPDAHGGNFRPAGAGAYFAAAWLGIAPAATVVVVVVVVVVIAVIVVSVTIDQV
jgi:hypothetical protein